MRIVQDAGLLLARLALGLVLVAHGWIRYQHGMQAQIDYLTTAHVPAPTVFAWGALVLEMLGGVLLVLGLATRVVGAVLVAENVLIIVWLRFNNGLLLNDRGYEYNLILAALALLFLCFGAGRAALDVLFGRRQPYSSTAARAAVDEYEPA